MKRVWIPVVVVVVAGGVVAGLWTYPGDLDRANRVFSGQVAVLGAAAALTLWLVALSGVNRVLRLSVVLLELAAALIFVPRLGCSGDMGLVLRPPDPYRAVEEHRQQQLTAAGVAIDPTPGDADWPEYRGRRRDGAATGPALSRDWAAKPPRLVWKQPCGEGWAGFAVAGNIAVTMEQRRDRECVVAYHADTGRELWRYEHPARFKETMGGVGPRATPTISDGYVFSLGAAGHLSCVDARTGAVKWTADVLEGNANLRWGMAGSPLVVDNLVIVTPGCQTEENPRPVGVLAFDRATGAPVWAGGDNKGAYSSPLLATLAGRKQLLAFEGKRLAGYDVADGKLLWHTVWHETREDINVAQPLVDEAAATVFISSGYNVGCALVKVGQAPTGEWGAQPLWVNQNKPLRCKFSSPVEYKGHFYGLDDGILACINAADGTLRWREPRYGHGQMVRCDDLLIVLAENGRLALVQATPDEFRELGRVQALDGKTTWNTPALANGRLYVRNESEMACYDLRQ